MALAAVGAARVPVRRRPRAAVIATGRELVAPEFAPAPGQIRDASSTYLAAALPAFGVEPLSLRVVGDDADAFEGELLQALSAGADLIITTGAVSKGDADFVPAVLKRLGFETLFHGVSIRPGKPVLLARAPGGQVIFALPGNPVSTVVGLRFFVDLYLRRLLGRPDESPSRARLAEAVDKPEQLRCFFKSVREFDGAVKVLPGQASFQIHSLVAADCWAVLPEGKKRLLLGEEVDVYPLSEPLA
jgi:molybdopterin molybdotransferase